MHSKLVLATSCCEYRTVITISTYLWVDTLSCLMFSLWYSLVSIQQGEQWKRRNHPVGSSLDCENCLNAFGWRIHFLIEGSSSWLRLKVQCRRNVTGEQTLPQSVHEIYRLPSMQLSNPSAISLSLTEPDRHSRVQYLPTRVWSCAESLALNSTKGLSRS